MTSNARTTTAFSKYRWEFSDQTMNSTVCRYGGDTDQMGAEEGLKQWVDGPVQAPESEPTECPEVPERPNLQYLWVVTSTDILHALETCDFGAHREAGVAKHSNLTGGKSAFVGGELVFLDEKTVAITGSSGRYRLRGLSEMTAIERAFLESGYNVWSMGYNKETNRPNLFGLSDPVWVSP